jgi:two-component system response regulator AlgR
MKRATLHQNTGNKITKSVDACDVTHFMADHKYVSVNWPGGELIMRGRLKDLEVEFAPDFIVVHRSYLVRSSLLIAVRHVAVSNTYEVDVQGVAEPLVISRRKIHSLRALIAERNAATA